MNFGKNKTKATAIALILTLTMIVMMIVPDVYSQSDLAIPTFLEISAAPNPVGVGQNLYINVFFSKPIATSGFTGVGDMYEGITVDIIDPDGSTTTLGPTRADATGGAWYTIVPSKTGNYTLQAFYPGQTTSLEGTRYFGEIYTGIEYEPTESPILTVQVQEEEVHAGYGSPPLPTEYWSRPIFATNWAWAELGSHWLQAGGSGSIDASGAGKFQPYGTAPNTAHILWMKPTAIGGQPGAPMSGDQESNYISTSIAMQSWDAIILNGILYYDEYPAMNSIPNSWQAIDLRTGQALSTWNTTRGITGDEILKCGEVLGTKTIQEYGVFPLLWSTPRTGPTIYRLYDPMTGQYLCQIGNTTHPATNMNFIPDYSEDTTEPGTLLGWYTSGGNLTLWNSTRAIAYPEGFGKPRFRFGTTFYYTIDMRPTGEIPFDSGIQWSVPIPTTLNGQNITTALSIAARTPEVILMRSADLLAPQTSNGHQITAGFDAKTGALLWGPLNQTLPVFHDISLMVARDGVYILRDKDTSQVWGYSLETGQKLWGPVTLPHNAWSTLVMSAEIAYGKVYIWDYGGYVNALDINTGEIVWTWEPRDSENNTPYGIYPFWSYSSTIADGKLFLPEGKLYDPPLSPDARRIVLNCTDGSLVWSMMSFAPRVSAPIAEGFMCQWDCYTKMIECFGKGQTVTTVEASPKVSVHGSSVLVEGMVTDESPGTKDSDRIARFPHGVPAISEEIMSDWMAYVYMQQPCPTNVTGVEAIVEVLDPNGNSYEVGRTTSDASGMFKLAFTPEVPGEYTVIATFAGSESYYSSYAETAINVEEAPVVTPEPTPVPQAPVETYFAASTIAIIVAIAIAVVLLLRKR